ALATLNDLPYYRRNFRRVIATRARLTEQLTKLGFQVSPSETNFILVRPPILHAEQWLAELRKRKILVRWFQAPEVRDYLRISIGTEGDTSSLISAVKSVLISEGRVTRARGNAAK